jgi:hypothetical protein
MLQVKQDLTLDVLPEPRHITLNVAGITPGNLTLLDALDIADASGVGVDEMVDVLKGPQNRTQGLLLYAMAWVMGRRVEPGLTFEEVKSCHLHVVGSAASDDVIEAEQKRAAAVVSVALLAGVSPAEAEDMTVAEVSAVTSITKARRRARRR